MKSVFKAAAAWLTAFAIMVALAHLALDAWDKEESARAQATKLYLENARWVSKLKS